jgi:hypothetical protein
MKDRPEIRQVKFRYRKQGGHGISFASGFMYVKPGTTLREVITIAGLDSEKIYNKWGGAHLLSVREDALDAEAITSHTEDNIPYPLYTHRGYSTDPEVIERVRENNKPLFLECFEALSDGSSPLHPLSNGVLEARILKTIADMNKPVETDPISIFLPDHLIIRDNFPNDWKNRFYLTAGAEWALGDDIATSCYDWLSPLEAHTTNLNRFYVGNGVMSNLVKRGLVIAHSMAVEKSHKIGYSINPKKADEVREIIANILEEP